MTQDPDAVRAAFTDPQEFWSSPLYRRLSAVVATDPYLVSLAAHARDGQQPTFMFFGVVQALLLDGVAHPLGDYYASLHGDDTRPPDSGADAALTSFAHEHEATIAGQLATRLVQTNHPRRAAALRLGLAAIAAQLRDRTVHLLEIGCSAGLTLRHDAYGYRLGGRQFGDVHSPVQLVTQWGGDDTPPDLDAIAPVVAAAGIDLNPLDPADPADRRWLHALVWPEDRDKDAQLTAALLLAQERPITVLAGDAVEQCPRWAAGVPSGAPRVVFHCATRMHVPRAHRPAFDAAIAAVGDDGPLFTISLDGDGLLVRGPGGELLTAYDVDGHLAWAAPR